MLVVLLVILLIILLRAIFALLDCANLYGIVIANYILVNIRTLSRVSNINKSTLYISSI